MPTTTRTTRRVDPIETAPARIVQEPSAAHGIGGCVDIEHDGKTYGVTVDTDGDIGRVVTVGYLTLDGYRVRVLKPGAKQAACVARATQIWREHLEQRAAEQAAAQAADEQHAARVAAQVRKIQQEAPTTPVVTLGRWIDAAPLDELHEREQVGARLFAWRLQCEQAYGKLRDELESLRQSTGLELFEHNVNDQNTREAGYSADSIGYWSMMLDQAAFHAGMESEQAGRNINELLGRTIY